MNDAPAPNGRHHQAAGAGGKDAGQPVDVTASRTALVAAQPEIRRLMAALSQAIRPATQGQDWAPETEAVFHAAVALEWLTEALAVDDDSDQAQRLIDAVARMQSFTTAAHRRIAELRPREDLAGDEDRRRVNDCVTTALIYKAELAVILPNGTETSIELAPASEGGVSWTSARLQLAAVDGPTQLAVTAAVTQLEQTLTEALPDEAWGDQ
ncbi:hypothetical protein ACIA49_38545 [Kribbella sp. NPDC051587]|uniref:hypothetical protein n=1 Tax=Kribbella sp. NPDC051587 TaxID=3364119 RepID=UPI0037B5F179